MCLECHGREALAIKKLDKSRGQEDVHFAQGMECHDCHSSREIHGDGTPYVSMKQEGAMDAKCENCHESVSPSESHTVHNGKLACAACHVRHSLSCANCHFDSLLKEGKRRSLVMSDWVFLINFRNKVTSGNMQTFVVGKDRTFLMFAPQFTHSVMKSGRKCEACHGTDTARTLQNGSLALTWMEHGEHVNRKGVVPLVSGVKYTNAYQNFEEGKWVPVKNPHQPEPHYVGFGSPLSATQLGALLRSPDELRKGVVRAEANSPAPPERNAH
jgi:hypothetical protein